VVTLPDDADLLAGLAGKIAPEAATRLEARSVRGVLLLVGDVPAPFHLAFTTRHHGLSVDEFASLNLSPRVGDCESAVEANRDRLSNALGMLENRSSGRALTLLSPVQEHGLRTMTASDWCGSRPPCDGLIVRRGADRGFVPALLFADCVPVALVSADAVAVLHCGWRGLLKGMIQAGARALGAPVLSAFIGPSVGPCCFEVDEDVASGFRRRYGEGLVGEARRLDLWEVAARALSETGAEAGQIVNPRLCTFCNGTYFYSHRRQRGRAGRQAAVAWEES
jgi:polyphenol oxidase